MNRVLIYFLYYLWKGIVFVLVKVFFRYQYFGLEKIPLQGGVLVAANHSSNLDPFLLGCIIPRWSSFLIKAEAFRPRILNWFLLGMGFLPMKRDQFDREGIKAVVDLLKRGGLMVLFPEGTRSPDGEMRRFKSGVGKLAYEADAVIVPVWIQGAYEAWPRHKRFFRLKKVRTFFGDPIEIAPIVERVLKENPEAPQKQIYQEITEQVQNTIKELKSQNAAI